MTVKVPTGMKEADLARPVIEVRDFETGELKNEIYTYGEQTIVMDMDLVNGTAEGERRKTSVEKIAESGWNLDIKNPFVKEEEVTHTTGELLQMLSDSFKKSEALIKELKKSL